jgi:hypothetical protein
MPAALLARGKEGERNQKTTKSQLTILAANKRINP